MTKIDNKRIGEVFRALSTSPTSRSSELRNTSNSIDHRAAESSESDNKRNLEDLRRRIVARISEISVATQKPSNEEIATIAIKEIVHWEFGDDVYSYPQLQNAIAQIIDSLKQSPGALEKYSSVISSLK